MRLPGSLDASDIKLLRVFHRVVECGGFMPAQAELNVSASTISTQMAALEARLGMRLCQRGRSGFRLTENGKAVHAAADRLFSAIESFRGEVGSLRGELTGELQVGVLDATITNRAAPLHRAIARFAGRSAAVHVTLHVDEPAALERGLLEGRLHVAVAVFYHPVPGLDYLPLYTEHQSLYCGAGHPLFADAPDGVRLDQIADAPYVARGYMGSRLPVPEIRFSPRATAYNMEAIAHFILSGRFIGYLPDHYAAPWVEGGAMRPLLPGRAGYASRFEVAQRKGVPRAGVADAFVEDLLATHAAGAAG